MLWIDAIWVLCWSSSFPYIEFSNHFTECVILTFTRVVQTLFSSNTLGFAKFDIYYRFISPQYTLRKWCHAWMILLQHASKRCRCPWHSALTWSFMFSPVSSLQVPGDTPDGGRPEQHCEDPETKRWPRPVSCVSDTAWSQGGSLQLWLKGGCMFFSNH